MLTLKTIKVTGSEYSVCQESPGRGLIWIRRMNGREVERSSGAFYGAMGNGWHPDPIVACVQGIRRKCSKVRAYLK